MKYYGPYLFENLASGEAAGRFNEMLQRTAGYLERQFDRFITTAQSLIEPLIIVVTGSIAATIVLSILLWIIQLNTLAITPSDASDVGLISIPHKRRYEPALQCGDRGA